MSGMRRLFVLCALIGMISIPPATAGATESFLEAAGPLGALRGTLLDPAGRKATILILPGSGPTDRDGNSPLGVKASTYRLLAEGLAAQGIASVRIDKRGMFASAAAVKDANAVTVEDYVADTKAWVGAARKATGASCVWLLGHSEGGLITLAAAQAVTDICGIVLVATPGRSFGTLLRDQLRANPANAPLLDQADAAITALEAGQPVSVGQMHPALQRLFAPAVQGFLASVMGLNPARLAAAYKGPVLVLQGEADLQVSAADAKRLAEAAPGATLTLLQNVNHVLKAVPKGDPRANMAAYADPALPLAPGVLEAVAGFVLANRDRP